MKAVLLSIKPKYCELIASGKKTLEIRKSKPKLEVPFKVYIYCTQLSPYNPSFTIDYENPKGNLFYGGKNHSQFMTARVIGEFICDYIIGHCESSNADIAEQRACVKREDVFKYSNGKEVFGWHISDLKIYDESKWLREFHYPTEKYCEKGLCDGCPYDEVPILKSYGDVYDYDCGGERPLAHPPQNWCYVEEL